MKLEEKVKFYKERLDEIANSLDPINPNMRERHDERVRAAKRYILELNTFFFPEEARIVSIDVFNRRIENENYWIIDEGEFVKVAATIEYPLPNYSYIVYFHPYSQI